MRLFFILLLFAGCREFYDEEFEEFQENNARNVQDVTYTASLRSTNNSLANLDGNVTVEVLDDQVTVDLDLDGIPGNVIQIHYTYLNASCDSLISNFVTDTSTTRSFTINEVTSVDALAEDLASSGTASSEGDINLQGKSFVVRAFSNFSGIPNNAGTNQLTIACGELLVEDNGVSNIDIFTPDDPVLNDPFSFPDDRGDVGTDNIPNF